MPPRLKCTCRAATNNAKKLHASTCAFFVPRTPIAESNYLRSELLGAATRYDIGREPLVQPRLARGVRRRHRALPVGAALAFADALRAERAAPEAAPPAPPAPAAQSWPVEEDT